MAAQRSSKENLDWEEDFPAKGSSADKLNFLLKYAALFPSVRGLRPWKFAVENDAVNLFLDRSRARRPTDPDVRELIISCGVVLQHLHVAARQFGLKLVTDAHPSDDPNLLATVKLDGRQPPAQADSIMFYAIHKWQDARRPLRANKKVPADLLAELEIMGNQDDTWLFLARTEAERSEMASLVVVGEAAQKEQMTSAKKKPSSAVAKKRRSDPHKLSEGIDAVGRYVLSFLPMISADKASAQRREMLAQSEPVLAVIGTYEDDRKAWLTAGRALGSVLLRSLSIGVRASLVNQPVQNTQLRGLVCSAIGRTGFPQVMFRLGYPVAEARAGGRPDGSDFEELL